MDGIEWKRSKWNYFIKIITKCAEYIAVKFSKYLIADNEGIKEYIKDRYNKQSRVIAYGCDTDLIFNRRHLLNVLPDDSINYFLIIARLEPENNIEMIIDGYLSSNTNLPIIVIGDYKNKYGEYLREKFNNNTNVNFAGSIYNKNILDSLRHFCKIYFHGHSVGGTNPSLIEAMAARSNIAYHKNQFNQTVINSNGLSFKNSHDVKNIINNSESYIEEFENWKSINYKRVKSHYNWNLISKSYIDFLMR